jgi:hypothetical protein
MTEKSTTGRSAPNPDPEMYQIYVRVPRDLDDSVVAVRKFLKEIAALLTDDARNVEVVPYEGYDDKWAEAAKKAAAAAKKTAAKKTAAKKAPGKKAPGKKSADAPDPEGGPRSPLYPMYVCHNKF